MKNVKKIADTIVPFVLVIAIVVLSVFFPSYAEELPCPEVVRIWNVDTFEGGKGSRTNFLKSVAQGIQKRNENVYYIVTSYTVEGAKYAFEQGEFPDVLSFGIGLSQFAERSLPLKYRFAGGTLQGESRAYPWCRGGYYLFSLTEDFDETGRVALSCGGENLSQVVAQMEGIVGEEVDSVTAYTGFLGGKYRYLLGTQRDVCRFSVRGVNVYQKTLSAYCDLYQYISILSASKVENCNAFLDELLTAGQEKLAQIGMYSLLQNDPPSAAQTINVFSSDEALSSLRADARAGNIKNIEKNLKSI